MSARVARAAFVVWLVLCGLHSGARAGELVFDFRTPAAPVDAATPGVMRDLAERLLPVYQESDHDLYLANVSALQMAAGDFEAADRSREELRERRRVAEPAKAVTRAVVYDMYAHAKALQAADKISFAESFGKTLEPIVSALDDQNAFQLIQWLEAPPASFQNSLQRSFDQQRPKDSITEPEAIALLWKYVAFEAYRTFGPLSTSLAAQEDARRYVVETPLMVASREGAALSLLVIRPKVAAQRLPTLLEFTIYGGASYARECAAHGYVGVVAYTRSSQDAHGVPPPRARGSRGAPAGVVPFQFDGVDARRVIGWIAQQPWSDGRVGMYGEGYSAFAAWAAAAHAPSALKAIATGASMAPGIDMPLGGNIFQNSAYRWSLQVTDPGKADSYGDDAVWRALNQKWYRSGRRYRDLGRIYGRPNPIFQRWLNHPSYDRFWQKMIPFRREFARVNIPVLTMTGYFAASAPADLYYFTEHHRYNPHADHTLLIGPYDDNTLQRTPAETLHGYALDAAALIDLHELRFEWFDHIFKDGQAPALLADRVNFEVMGANTWQHAASLEDIAGDSLRFYLDSSGSGDAHRLSRRKSPKLAFAHQTVSLRDRSDAAWTPPTDLISKRLVAHNGLMFVSEPLSKAADFNGLFSGRLDFTVNKMDLDLNLMIYERLATGEYIRLFNPAYELRASYVRDRVHRSLLKAGERQQLDIRSDRMVSRHLQAGSRLVVVLSVNKRPDREINYGTGNDVSEESIADGKVPLKLRWYSDSYIEIPIRK